MKKMLSAAAAAILAAMPVFSAFTVNAADYYSPLFYIKAQSGLNTDADGNILVNIDELSASQEGLLLNADVFIQDDALNCWSVNPKWKSDSEFITLNHLCNPLRDHPENLDVYAYAETDENGDLKVYRHSVLNTVDKECNTMNYTCMKMPAVINGYMDDSPMIPYGEKSDDYPLTSFDMIVSPDTPPGDYEIFFLTEPIDYPDQRITTVSTCKTDTDPSRDFVPRTQSIHIIVSEDGTVPSYILGDLNGDGAVDSTDASAVLAAYARVSTGNTYRLNRQQIAAADINEDSSVDSSDASLILMYYSYISTGGTISFEDYLAQLG